MLQIYCGDGKGKTTAAVGLAVRGAGAGMNVRFVQFMKGGYTSELSALEKIPDITICRCDRNYGFFKNMTDADKAEITRRHDELLEFAFGAENGTPEMIILDEFFSAYNYGLMNIELAERLIFENKNAAEIVLTGRDPAEVFQNAADYISEIKCVRHPYSKGIAARKGIEF